MRPYIMIEICGHELRMLFDTGSTQSYIHSPAFAKITGESLTPNNEIHVKMANGSTEPILGTFETEIGFNGKRVSIKFRVLGNLNYEGILGMDGIKGLGLDFHFAESQLATDKPSCVMLDEILPLIENSCASLQEINATQRKRINKLVDSILPKGEPKLGMTNLVEHHIDVQGHAPIKQKAYDISPRVREAMHAEVRKMLEQKIVEPSASPWSSPVVMIKKKDGSYRFCVDMRRVNALTVKDSYPIPQISSVLNKLNSAKYITTLDLKNAYFQIPMAADSKEITAFTVPGMGLFQFLRLVQGLTNAPATFQRLLDWLIGPKMEPFVFVYLDDIIIITQTFEQHLEQLEIVLKKIHKAGFTINREKSHFCCREVKYLGFIVNSQGLSVDKEKILPILEYPEPQNLKQLQRFIGMSTWYRKFIPNFSARMEGLLVLLRDKKHWFWNEEQQRSFDDIKSELASTPILACPDWSVEFVLQCDASSYGLGAVLTQTIDGVERVIAFASQILNKSQRNYTVTEKECLAVVWAVKKFRCYLEGFHFTVITDHSSLRWLHNLKNPSGRLARWALELLEYDYEIVHRKGALHHVPDALSRMYESTEMISATQEGEILNPWYVERYKKVQDFPERYPNWKIENDQLYFHRPDPILDQIVDDLDEWKIVVPESLRRRVISEGHDSASSGHAGIDKTYARIAKDYYWVGIYSDVVKYVRECQTCQASKASQIGRSGLMGEKNVETPWKIVSADCMGPYPRTRSGFTHILVLRDMFTRWVEYVPLRAASGKNVRSAFESRIIFRYGVPSIWLTDNGPEFKNRVIRSMTQGFGIKHMFTPPYSPHCNGGTENSNRFLKQMIVAFVDKDHLAWDEHLHEFQFATNTAVHSSTGFSPAFLNFGRNPEVPQTLRAEVSARREVFPGSITEWQERMIRLSHIRDLVKKSMEDATRRQARYYNRDKKDKMFFPGDTVWRRNKTLSNALNDYSARLQKRYVGPFFIEKRISPVIYLLKDAQGRLKGKWHIKDLKIAISQENVEEKDDLADGDRTGNPPEEQPTGGGEETRLPRRPRGRPRKQPAIVTPADAPEQPRRKRGRPRRQPTADPPDRAVAPVALPRRPRGRPRKQPVNEP